MFFFIYRNTGGKEINTVVNQKREKGITRAQLGRNDFEDLIKSKALTREGGLKDSDLVTRSFIDQYIPFLPLEKEHIKQCIVQYLHDERGFPNPMKYPGGKFIEEAANDLIYLPSDTEVFAQFGCRKVKNIVDTLL